MYRIRTLFTVFATTLLVGLFVAGCSSGDEDNAPAAAGSAGASESQAEPGSNIIQQQFDLSMTFTSPVFNEKRRIPKVHTCIGGTVDKPGEYFARSNLTPTDAQNLSPPLTWSRAPDGTQSFALIMHSTELVGSDELWTHWVIWNIPAEVTELAKGVEEIETLANGASQGLNGGGVVGYLGPCPPNMLSTFKPQDQSGQTNPKQEIEKYYFEIYALDTKLDLAAGATRDELLQAMDGHILAGGELVGERQGKLIRKEDT